MSHFLKLLPHLTYRVFLTPNLLSELPSALYDDLLLIFHYSPFLQIIQICITGLKYLSIQAVRSVFAFYKLFCNRLKSGILPKQSLYKLSLRLLKLSSFSLNTTAFFKRTRL